MAFIVGRQLALQVYSGGLWRVCQRASRVRFGRAMGSRFAAEWPVRQIRGCSVKTVGLFGRTPSTSPHHRQGLAP